MSLKRFLTSRLFFRHLALAVAITAAILLIVLLALKFYTRHGESLPVPDLLGMTEEQFSVVLDKSNLEYVIVDSTYKEEVIAGGAIDQVPDAGMHVKRNRKVFITINAVAPELVSVPPLTDISMRQSLSQLESVGLLPGSITFKPSEFHNLVLEAKFNGSRVSTGELLPKGSMIDLVVGTGDSRGSVRLPNLRGLTLDLARTVLVDSLLSVGAVIYDESVITKIDTLQARIWKQHPSRSESSYISIGASVDIWLTTDESRISEEYPEDQNTGIRNEEEESFF
ncbi:MAG TPA: hypothetical protein DCY35_01765 [Prolixibacteraceae bacterium]|nr:hypothetical protein [Prolixibacteraceae bacterium]